jgi:hypothetical protein
MSSSAVKSPAVPLCILLLLYAAFFAYVEISADRLPERVASHFGGGGQADGWMTRTGYLEFIALFGLAFPLSQVGIFFITRFFPPQAFNLPNREYWLAPARLRETHAWLLRHSLWLACLMVGFVTALHFTTIVANREQPAHLPMPMFSTLMGCILAGVAAWVAVMVWHFRRQDSEVLPVIGRPDE